MSWFLAAALAALALPAGAQTYLHHPYGEIDRITYGNGTVVELEYDPEGNLVEKRVFEDFGGGGGGGGGCSCSTGPYDPPPSWRDVLAGIAWIPLAWLLLQLDRRRAQRAYARVT
jgi:YD repeat-containing protein